MHEERALPTNSVWAACFYMHKRGLAVPVDRIVRVVHLLFLSDRHRVRITNYKIKNMKRMLQYLLAIVVGFTLLACTKGTKKPDAPERYGWLHNTPLYGDVKQVEIHIYNNERDFEEVYHFNINGNATVTATIYPCIS